MLRWLPLFCVSTFACGETKGGVKSTGEGPIGTTPRSGSQSAGPDRSANNTTAQEHSFKPSCNSSYAPKPDRDASPMCLVPAGEFTMGTPVEAARPEDGPARRVRVATAFYIDQDEVTNEQFVRFLRAPESTCNKANRFCLAGDSPHWLDTKTLAIKAGMEQLPAEVPFAAAESYCAWVGKRLPTEAEWELAARHDPVAGADRTYPWGDDLRPGVTNSLGAFDPKRGRLAVAGTFKDDRSPIGARDMGGNAHEWVADCFATDVACSGICDATARTTGCAKVCTEGDIVRCETARLAKGGSSTSHPEQLKSKLRISTFPNDNIGVRCGRSQ